MLKFVRRLGRPATEPAHPQKASASIGPDRLPRARFRCAGTGEITAGFPAFACVYPQAILDIPEDQRSGRVEAGSDFCVVDGQRWFIRCTAAHPVQRTEHKFGYGLWAEVGEHDFQTYWDNFELVRAKHLGPFKGHLANRLPDIADTNQLSCHIHLSDQGERPSIELMPCDHPFYFEQENGLSVERAICLARLVPGFEILFDA